MKKRKVRIQISRILFLMYIIVMVHFLFLSDDRYVLDSYMYNLRPFQEINRFIRYRHQIGLYSALLNLMGNIIAFMPFGMLVQRMTKKKLNIFIIFILCFGFTFTIEVIQLITKLGRFDIDDIILNTLGGLLGYMLYRVDIFIRKRKGRKNAIKSK